MLGIPLRYLLKRPVIAVADLAADPLEIWTTIHDAYVAQREQRGPSAWSTSAGGVSKKSRPFRSNLSSGLGTGI
jgi:hypothetical protein